MKVDRNGKANPMAYFDVNPMDIDPDTNRPYANYSAASLDTSFHDGEMDTDEADCVSSFNIGDTVLWSNGVEGEVKGINTLDGQLMDHCGGWHLAGSVERL